MAGVGIVLLLLASSARAQRQCPTDSSGQSACPEPVRGGVAIRAAAISGCTADATRAGFCVDSTLALGVTDPPGWIPAGHGQCATDSLGNVKFDALGRAICGGGCAFGQ